MELDYVKLREIKPVLAGYIRDSQLLLSQTAVPDDNAVHDVRVLMKKARAALKLAAPQMDKELTDRDMVSLREVGRIMCSWRETSVHRKTLKELKKEFPEIFAALADNETINGILKKPALTNELTGAMKEGMEEINALLNKTAFRIRFYSMNKLDPRLLIKELELTYARVTDIYLTCRNNLKPDDLHEFRKQAKDFLYQLYFFRPLNPTVVKSLEKKLDSLTLSQGRFNDLSQLVKRLDYKYSRGRYQPAMDELVIRIREKQDGYLSDIWPAAFKIFCPGRNLVNLLGFKLLVI
jgi:CHAD domain-containing protein